MNDIGFPNIQKVLHKPVQLQPEHIMKLWRERPSIFIEDVFDLTHDGKKLTLDDWQEESFQKYLTHQRLAMVANKGPGKTFTLAMMTWHFFMTNHMAKIAVLAISKDHLKSNLWAELAKLHASSTLISKSVEAGSEKFSLKGHELYSFIDARSYPKTADSTQMASTLAGVHADNVAFVLDEAGMIPDAILATADNALSGGESDTMKKKILAAGNPEVAQGLIYRAATGKSVQKWAIVRVTGDPDNPKRAKRVDVDWAREQIATFGKDDPWVQVNVFGEYPTTAMDSLLSDAEISTSMKRNIDENEVKSSQYRMGVDVARGGVDRTVFARRRGLKGYPLELFPSTHTGPELAGMLALRSRDEVIERIFVDNTGGYGSSVIDSLNLFPGIDITPVVYNKKAQDKRYFNVRTEMYVRLRDWVKKGGQLPNDPQLAEELMMPKLIFHGGIFRLEDKESIKARLGRSPDRADAFAQTFMDIDQISFFAEGSALPTRKLSHDEMVQAWKDGRLGGTPRNNYLSDESQIDNRYNSSPNYRS